MQMTTTVLQFVAHKRACDMEAIHANGADHSFSLDESLEVLYIHVRVGILQEIGSLAEEVSCGRHLLIAHPFRWLTRLSSPGYARQCFRSVIGNIITGHVQCSHVNHKLGIVNENAG